MGCGASSCRVLMFPPSGKERHDTPGCPLNPNTANLSNGQAFDKTVHSHSHVTLESHFRQGNIPEQPARQQNPGAEKNSSVRINGHSSPTSLNDRMNHQSPYTSNATQTSPVYPNNFSGTPLGPVLRSSPRKTPNLVTAPLYPTTYASSSSASFITSRQTLSP